MRTPSPASSSTMPFVAALILSLAVSLFAVGPVSASDMRNHRLMTEHALRNLGWIDEAAIAITADYSQATDLGRIPGSTVKALQFGMPKCASQVPAVQSLAETASFNADGTSGFHFNNLYAFSDIALQWKMLRAWSDAVAERIGHCPPEDRDRLRPVLFGLVAHAVQDFYCHSNWIGIMDRHLPASAKTVRLPLWEELIGEDDAWRAAHPEFPSLPVIRTMMLSDAVCSGDEEEGGLQTGKPRVVDLGSFAPWGHRHKGGDEMEAVHDLGVRATALWIARLDAVIETASEKEPPLIAGR